MGQPPSVRADGPAPECIGRPGGTAGTETSQYREEQESNERPVVVASEPGGGLNRPVGNDGAGLQDRLPAPAGGRPWVQPQCQPKRLGRRAGAGESPVGDGCGPAAWGGT
jgi:hypothetical protein